MGKRGHIFFPEFFLETGFGTLKIGGKICVKPKWAVATLPPESGKGKITGWGVASKRR